MARGFTTDEQSARKFLERRRWPDGPVCPFCKKADAVKVLGGKSMGKGWYHCRECRRKFTVRVGTIMARSHITLDKWLDCFSLLSEADKNHRGLRVIQLSRALKITRKSARLMLDRINARNERRRHAWGGPVWWES
jgi:transposase-like protein